MASQKPRASRRTSLKKRKFSTFVPKADKTPPSNERPTPAEMTHSGSLPLSEENSGSPALQRQTVKRDVPENRKKTRPEIKMPRRRKGVKRGSKTSSRLSSNSTSKGSQFRLGNALSKKQRDTSPHQGDSESYSQNLLKMPANDNMLETASSRQGLGKKSARSSAQHHANGSQRPALRSTIESSSRNSGRHRKGLHFEDPRQ